MEGMDPRALRLFDLADHEAVIVRCQCGSIVQYGRGFLQRNHRVSSDTLIFDLQFRLRCKHCTRTRGFRIEVQDVRPIEGSVHRPPPKVIVDPDA